PRHTIPSGPNRSPLEQHPFAAKRGSDVEVFGAAGPVGRLPVAGYSLVTSSAWGRSGTGIPIQRNLNHRGRKVRFLRSASMRVGVVRVLVAAAGLLWLAGCETTSTGPENPLKSLASASNADPEATGSIKPPPGFLPGSPPRQPDLAGED